MKKKIIWISVIAAAGIASLFIALNQGTAVAVDGVKKDGVKAYVEDIGTVKCRDTMIVCIEGSGLIQHIAAEVGMQVKKGDLLLSMDTRQLEIQIRESDERIKEIEAALAGSEIKNYATRVEKARIAVEQAETDLTTALNDAEKARILAAADAISRVELDQKEAALKNAQAAFNTARLNLQEIENNTPESIKSGYQAQMEQVALSRESLRYSLGKQVVTAPMDGIVLEKKVEVNTMGTAGTVAFVIGNMESIEMEAYILADDVPEIAPGDEVEIVQRSGDKKVISGKVAKIAPSATNVTSSLGVNQKKVAVTIELQDHAVSLQPGYEADVRVITGRRDDVPVVPLSSVFDYNDQSCVFVVENGRAVLRSIKKGLQDDSFVEVADGLKEGELVLSEPDLGIKEGMKIKLE